MKHRFLGLLAALGLVSAAVLVLVSHARTDSADSALLGAADVGACAMSGVKAASVDASDDCCALEPATSAVATLSAGGCPYVSGATQPVAATIATSDTALGYESGCCAAEAAAAKAE